MRVVMPSLEASRPASVDLPVPDVPASMMQMLRLRSCTLCGHRFSSDQHSTALRASCCSVQVSEEGS